MFLSCKLRVKQVKNELYKGENLTTKKFSLFWSKISPNFKHLLILNLHSQNNEKLYKAHEINNLEELLEAQNTKI